VSPSENSIMSQRHLLRSTPFLGADGVSRRAFVAGAARGLLGVTACTSLGWAASPAGRGARRATQGATQGGTARRVIYLYMSGGMSHLDTLDPKPGAATQGPTQAIPTVVDGMMLSQHFPLLARSADKIALVRSLQSTQGAHAQGRYYLHTSYELRGTIRHPSLGAWLSHLRSPENPTLPGHVAVGGDVYTASGGFLPSRHFPLPIGDPDAGLQDSRLPPTVTEEVFHRRMARVAQMNQAFAERHQHRLVEAYAEAYDQALALMRSEDLEAFDISAEPQDVRAAYGDDRFGKGCLLARRLVERGVGFVEVVSGGWDTHNDNFDSMEELCPAVDRGLTALLEDLHARGLLEDTLVVLATEFGRTPDIVEARSGRNHYPKAFSGLLAGGGIRGGQAFGRTDDEGREVVENPVPLQDFNATIAYALGLDLEREIVSPSGRPFRVADKGQPVRELFA